MTNIAGNGATHLPLNRPAGTATSSNPVGERQTMTAHVHNHSDAEPARRANALPRWLIPGLAIAFVVAGLILAGVVSLSTALFLGFFGGMILMHTGGHGAHGGHESTAPDAGRDDLASNSNGEETHEGGQHRSHGCH